MNPDRSFKLFALVLAGCVAALLVWWSTADAKTVTWTNPSHYSNTCGSPAVKPIPLAETKGIRVEMKQAEEDSLSWQSIGWIPVWVPGAAATHDIPAPGFGTWDFRVVPLAADANGTTRKVCPSNVWTWTITDTCVAEKVLDFGPQPPWGE